MATYQVEQRVGNEWAPLWVMDASFLPRTFATAEAAEDALFRLRRQRFYTPAPLGHYRIVARQQQHWMLDYLRLYSRLQAPGLHPRHISRPATLDYGRNLLRLHLIRLHQEAGREIGWDEVQAYFAKQQEALVSPPPQALAG
ncbi:hypothetical protein [Balneatrix alpica]|uniref:Uncharacterized protein n=1 Tax=Balneatrix alpica TaxID=75684 RepID=A0ABV5Z719_9GAMM|nr:hypothetical protein [Balneatrix alpica]